TAWEPVLDVAPPPKAKGDVGLDRSLDQLPWLVHAYAWGGRAAQWDRAGNFLVRVADPFAIAHPVWSTRTGHSPWADVVISAQAFGQDPSMGYAAWWAALDPVAHSGVLVVNSRGSSELFSFGESEPLAKIGDASQWGLSQITSA